MARIHVLRDLQKNIPKFVALEVEGVHFMVRISMEGGVGGRRGLSWLEPPQPVQRPSIFENASAFLVDPQFGGKKLGLIDANGVRGHHAHDSSDQLVNCMIRGDDQQPRITQDR